MPKTMPIQNLFGITSSSRHEKYCQMLERLFVVFRQSKNIPWLPRRLVQKQESYQRAILVGGVGSFSGSMNQSEDRTAQMLLIRQEAMEKSSARSSPRISPSTSRTSVTRGSFKKQDSYNRAIEKGKITREFTISDFDNLHIFCEWILLDFADQLSSNKPCFFACLFIR